MARAILRLYCLTSGFCKIGETFNMIGLRVKTTDDLDDVVATILATDGPVIADICIEKENCFR